MFIVYAGTALIAICILILLLAVNPIAGIIFLFLVGRFFKWLICG